MVQARPALKPPATISGAAIITTASAALLLLQLLWRNHLTGMVEYDDGVYFGASLNLAHGVLPYTAYRFIQPPGIVLFLYPFAWSARFLGAAHAWEMARVFTAGIEVLTVGLVGRLLRHRSPREMLTGMTFIAVYPGSVAAGHTTMIEPPLALLAVLTLLALFDGDELTPSAGRQRLAGVLAGIALTMKVWAIVPLAVCASALWLSGRNQRRTGRPEVRLILWAVVAFAGAAGPFAAGDPVSFVRQVVITQAIRPPGGFSMPQRLADLSGTSNVTALLFGSGHLATWLSVASFGLLVAMTLRMFVAAGATATTTLDAVAGTCIVADILTLIAAPTYYYHYSAFVAPYLAVVVSRAAHWWSPSRRPGSSATGRLIAASLIAVVTVVADVRVIITKGPPSHITAASRQQLRTRGCILYLFPGVGLLANHFTASRPDCPHVIDYYGEQRVLTHGLAQSPADDRNPALQRDILAWIRESNIVVVASAATDWGPDVRAYVAANFISQPLDPPQVETIYRRRSSS